MGIHELGTKLHFFLHRYLFCSIEGLCDFFVMSVPMRGILKQKFMYIDTGFAMKAMNNSENIHDRDGLQED